MKTIKRLSSIILGISILGAGYFIGNTQKNALFTDRTIIVKGLSEREVMADKGIWAFNIVLTGNDLKSIKSTLDIQKKTIIEFFTQLNVTDDELKIGTTNIQDIYVDNYSNNTINSPFRYIAKVEFTFITNDINKLEKVYMESINLLSQNIMITSVSTWEPIRYDFTKLNDLKPVMIEEATKNARMVAQKFAEDSDSKLGKIKSANQGVFSIDNTNESSSKYKVVRVVSTIEYFLND